MDSTNNNRIKTDYFFKLTNGNFLEVKDDCFFSWVMPNGVHMGSTKTFTVATSTFGDDTIFGGVHIVTKWDDLDTSVAFFPARNILSVHRVTSNKGHNDNDDKGIKHNDDKNSVKNSIHNFAKSISNIAGTTTNDDDNITGKVDKILKEYDEDEDEHNDSKDSIITDSLDCFSNHLDPTHKVKGKNDNRISAVNDDNEHTDNSKSNDNVDDSINDTLENDDRYFDHDQFVEDFRASKDRFNDYKDVDRHVTAILENDDDSKLLGKDELRITTWMNICFQNFNILNPLISLHKWLMTNGEMRTWKSGFKDVDIDKGYGTGEYKHGYGKGDYGKVVSCAKRGDTRQLNKKLSKTLGRPVYYDRPSYKYRISEFGCRLVRKVNIAERWSRLGDWINKVHDEAILLNDAYDKDENDHFLHRARKCKYGKVKKTSTIGEWNKYDRQRKEVKCGFGLKRSHESNTCNASLNRDYAKLHLIKCIHGKNNICKFGVCV